mgnify:FL=1
MYTRNLQVIYNNMRLERKKRSLTQKEVAYYLNIDRTTYCHYENGDIMPSIDFIINFCNYMKIDINNLFVV